MREIFDGAKVSVFLQGYIKPFNPHYAYFGFNPWMREKILEIAVEQFSHYGVRTVTMEGIAQLADIS